LSVRVWRTRLRLLLPIFRKSSEGSSEKGALFAKRAARRRSNGAFAAAGEAARAAHSASTTIVTICAYAHRLSLVIKVLPLT
jgi:hypothetical protein